MFIIPLVSFVFGGVSYAFASTKQAKLAVTNSGIPLDETSGCNRYASLGDSYSAGIAANPDGQLPNCTGINCGINPPYQTTSKCARNTGSYPWQYQFNSKTQVRFDPKSTCSAFTFIACSGADTKDMNANQIPAVPADADLVIFTIGGNDGDSFASIVKDCVYIPVGAFCQRSLANAKTTIANIGPSLDGVYRKLRSGWPKADIVALGYAQFWATTTYNESNCNSTFLSNVPSDRRSVMNSLVLALNTQIAAAAKRNGINYVDYDCLFDKSRLCDQQPSFFQYSLFGRLDDDRGPNKDKDPLDFFNKGVFHPTIAGHAAISTALTAYGAGQDSCPPLLGEDEL